MLNLNFQISSQDDNSFTSIYVLSVDNSQTSSLMPSENNPISDLVSLFK